MDNGLKNADDLLRGIFSHMGNVGLEQLGWRVKQLLTPSEGQARALKPISPQVTEHIKTAVKSGGAANCFG